MSALALPRLALQAIVKPFGYELSVAKQSSSAQRMGQFDAAHRSIIERVRPFTMTGPERIDATCSAVDHVIKYKIEGEFVECGVWRGGSTMAAALSFLRDAIRRPLLYLFDTFDGMTTPTEADTEIGSGRSAAHLLEQATKQDSVWAYASIAEVRRNIATTGYPEDHLRFVQGTVEQTIPEAAPSSISVLRLDTDWYASTKHELEHLFPRLSVGGILIIDDYGHWNGARRAVDEYFTAQHPPIFLARTDYTGRIGVKTS